MRAIPAYADATLKCSVPKAGEGLEILTNHNLLSDLGSSATSPGGSVLRWHVWKGVE